MWLGHIFAAAKRLLAKTHPPDGLLCALVAAARLAAHLALIVSASCARRSGVRLSFLFTFLGALGSFTAAAGFLPALPPGAADPFPETFKVFHIRKESPRPIVNENDGVDPEEITKPRECHAILVVVQHQLRPICAASLIRTRFQRIKRIDQNEHDGRFACAWRT